MTAPLERDTGIREAGLYICINGHEFRQMEDYIEIFRRPSANSTVLRCPKCASRKIRRLGNLDYNSNTVGGNSIPIPPPPTVQPQPQQIPPAPASPNPSTAPHVDASPAPAAAPALADGLQLDVEPAPLEDLPAVNLEIDAQQTQNKLEAASVPPPPEFSADILIGLYKNIVNMLSPLYKKAGIPEPALGDCKAQVDAIRQLQVFYPDLLGKNMQIAICVFILIAPFVAPLLTLLNKEKKEQIKKEQSQQQNPAPPPIPPQPELIQKNDARFSI